MQIISLPCPITSGMLPSLEREIAVNSVFIFGVISINISNSYISHGLSESFFQCVLWVES